MKTSRRFPLSRSAAALALAISLALAGCGGGDQPSGDQTAEAKPAEGQAADKKVEAVPVEVAAVARRPISASYSGTANLEAPSEAQVVAKTSGVLLELLAEEGDQVKAGQVLARIDPDRPRLEMQRARATVSKLENNYRRSQELLASKMVSAEASDQIRYDLEAARAAYELAKLELSYTNIVAPIDGVIASRSVKTGNLIQLNSSLFRIVDDSRLEAVLNVPERDLATMREGLAVRMLADAMPGKSFEGVIDRVSPVVDGGSGTFRVVTAFPGGQGLRPGMFGRIEVVYDQRADALTVPRAALLDDAGQSSVYAVRENKAVRVPVEVGHLSGELAEIRKGLEEGEQVVTAGKVTLRDGAAVEVLNPPSAAPVADVAQVAATAHAGN
ncbi:efflux RND transporter periplasmic adaptor subunit [Arenimonas caeni]|jgi:membrane fusion protein (multidrug efflux system)|uniref:Efflux transporter periplasmic adaptor subunit n=1 Tax=Arenimonas caeni TaxID=2058085 RepID=A0A2P6MAX9_9GAMM|nr:efflux RND transporter periplasmic adaptor subunit [Arenimonas caeni]MDY0022419.1 efflux RND transporter periplasmic adaptor subunit [Arenimonas caeni]PRH83112.1 efflux transporter periplasmic adaptor subunit [Arenimonas caeni]